MKRKAGLWINHKKAVIFSLSDEGAEIKRISAELGKPLRFSGEVQKESAEKHKDTRVTGSLNNYYGEVIVYIGGAESIFIFGPGEAKIELKKRLENMGLHGHIVGIETADTMTDNQIVLKVRQRFIT